MAREGAPWELEPSPLVMEKVFVLPSCLMVYQDDLPDISVSRLRATGVVSAEATRAVVSVDGVEVELVLQLVRFPNGGSWSFALCPHCGCRARTLKLFDGCVLCWR